MFKFVFVAVQLAVAAFCKDFGCYSSLRIVEGFASTILVTDSYSLELLTWNLYWMYYKSLNIVVIT